MFLNYTEHCTHSISNHYSLMLNTKGRCAFLLVARWFRFEAAWLLEESYEEEIRRLWTSSNCNVPQRLV